MSFEPTIVAFSGASGSGKSTLAEALVTSRNALSTGAAQLLPLDAYYRDLSALSFAERDRTNFDHPDSIEFERFYADLEILKSGSGVFRPVYDFSEHSRSGDQVWVESSPLLVIEGVLLPAWPELRQVVDLWVFVDTPLDLCLKRRIERDGITRGRTETSVRQFWTERVEPMYHAWGSQGRQMADLIVRGDADLSLALEQVIAALNK